MANWVNCGGNDSDEGMMLNDKFRLEFGVNFFPKVQFEFSHLVDYI
jgi:hypothetical protein